MGQIDTSELPVDHPCYTLERKKVPGYFSDECKGRTMYEFVALRAKSYAYLIEDKFDSTKTASQLRAKGVCKNARDRLSFNDFKNCLFENSDDNDSGDDDNDSMGGDGDDYISPYRENVSIRSYNHQIKTIKTSKLTLNRDDDKRIAVNEYNPVLTRAHFHFKN